MWTKFRKAARRGFDGAVSDGGLAEWLHGLDAEALAALLERRPDAVEGRAPSTLGQLALRLEHPGSLAAALRGLNAPALQALDALLALGERRTRVALIGLLAGGPGAEHARAVDAALADLAAAGLAWPGEGDRWEVPIALAEVLPPPLGLGPAARVVWGEQNVGAIDRALRALGRRPEGRKADKLATLLELLSDPDVVRERAASALPAVAEELRRMAWNRDDDDDYFGDRFEPGFYRRQHEIEGSAVDTGLLARAPWGFGATMPAEVALVLRGPEYRAPFTPRPPAVTARQVTADAVESAAGAAITQFLGRTVALLDRVVRAPVPTLAGGGVGVRELRRLAKELRVEESEIRLVLGLAAAAGLLLPVAEGLGVGEGFVQWRESEPAVQAGALLVAWWDFPDVPSRSRDTDGKVLPALRGAPPCAGCQAGRIVLLHAAASLPPGVAADAAELARAARWNRPLVHVLPEDADAPLATVYREAELLGTLAAGALTQLGAALLADDLAAAHEHLQRLIPEVTDAALFGADLTALVPGSPSARATRVLDGCADRESSGGGTTWRFSPASVRRALDAGITAEQLVEQLTELAGKHLPQPLTYLIGDVGRRHGALQLLSSASLIRSDDEALLAEVVADRRLAALGLQRVAPTVVACGVPLDQALARLRDAGYFPMAEGNHTPPAATSARRRAPARRPDSGGRSKPALAPVPEDLAQRLLAEGDTGLPALTSTVTGELARAARQLSTAELDWLAAAIEDGGRVRIEYLAAGGNVTRRVISDPELINGMVYAWCELRQDERTFSAERILSVAPAG